MIHHNSIYSRAGLFACVMLTLVMSACGKEDFTEYVPPRFNTPAQSDSLDVKPHPKQIEFEGINRDGLKILAIGNSYTWNGTMYLPWLFQNLDNDDAFIAILTQTGASLAMHWTNHVKNDGKYEMHYSQGGKWHKVSITTIDEALEVFDWDIVVMQQMSALAGIESSYQPNLDLLKTLIHDTNSHPQLAWQYTWAYTSDAIGNSNFKLFSNDSDSMHSAVISTCDKMSVDFDFRIPAGQLIKLLRDTHPSQADGFSTDGIHLTDPACYALSCLWHEVLVTPRLDTSSLDMEKTPSDISTDFAEDCHLLIKKVLSEFNAKKHKSSLQLKGGFYFYSSFASST